MLCMAEYMFTIFFHLLVQLTSRIRQVEADDKGTSIRKEFINLDKMVRSI